MDRLAQLEIENKALQEENRQLRAAHQLENEGSEKRLEVEKAYQKSQIRFRTIFEQSKLGNKIIDSDLRIIKVNKAFEEMLGYSEQELIYTKITQHAHPDSLKHWQELQERLWKHEMPSFHIEANMIRKDGSTLWCSITTILFEDNETTFGYTIVEDIAQRRQLTEQLADSESMLAQSQQAASVGSFIADLDSGLVHCSPELNRIFCLPEAEKFIHKDVFFGVFDTDTLALHKQILAKAIEQLGSYASEYKIVVKGLQKWIWEKGQVRKDAYGKLQVMGVVQANDSQTLQLLLGIINGSTNAVTVSKLVRDASGNIIDLRFVLFNTAAKRYIGASADDMSMIGKTMTQLFPHTLENGSFSRYVEVAETKKEAVGVEVFYAYEGMDHWFRENCYCFGDYIVIRSEDITQQKQSEERLRSIETLLLQSERIANLGAFEWNEEITGGIGSPQFYKILGLEADQSFISRATYLSCIHPEDVSFLNQYIANWEKTKGLYQTEYRIIRKNDGAIRHLWVRASLVDGKLMGAIMDITDQKENEEKLRRTEALLMQSEKIANIAAFDWSAEVTSGTGSPQLYRILGIDEPELFVIGDFFQLVHPEDLDGFRQYVANWVKTGGIYNTEYRIIRKSDGAIRHIWVRGDLVNGRLMGYFMDITERVEMEQRNIRLALRNEELDNFVYTASHDLRSPVNNMEMLVGFLAKEIKEIQENATAGMYLNLLNKSINDLKTTLQDLTSVTEIHPGEKKELVNLPALIEDVQLSLYEQIQEAGAEVLLELRIPFLSIPKKHARSLVFNMLSNALKFRSKDRKPVITVSTQLKNGKTRLSFSDNGIGIRKADQPKVFMIFKRFNPEIAGRGVGMYLVKRVIDLNNGDITLESQENMGTTFHITFPVE